MDDKSTLEKLKEVIISKQILNGNKCGISVIFLIEKLDVNFEEIKKLLTQLHDENFIIIRQGINQKLIFLKRKLSR